MYKSFLKLILIYILHTSFYISRNSLIIKISYPNYCGFMRFRFDVISAMNFVFIFNTIQTCPFHSSRDVINEQHNKLMLLCHRIFVMHFIERRSTYLRWNEKAAAKKNEIGKTKFLIIVQPFFFVPCKVNLFFNWNPYLLVYVNWKSSGRMQHDVSLNPQLICFKSLKFSSLIPIQTWQFHLQNANWLHFKRSWESLEMCTISWSTQNRFCNEKKSGTTNREILANW